MTLRRIMPSFGLLLAAACGGSQPPPDTAPLSVPPAELPPAPIETQTTAAAGAATPEEEASKAAPTPVVRVTEGLATPENVLYDAPNDRYLVSNINGEPLAADNNGYIMELAPDGSVTKEKFIAGGIKNVKLDAPKGMGISKGVLYVADITVVRRFDAKSGAPKGEIVVPGAGFLNAIAVAADGRVYVSDSGLKAGENGFEPMGADAVYVIEKDKPRAIAKSTELGNPNGLLSTDAGLLVVTFTRNELYRLDDKGGRHEITKLPQGGLDGIVAVNDTLFISSWQGSAIYRGKLGGEFETVFAGLRAPAAIGVDTKRNLLLVPRFMDNAVETYALP